MRALRASELLFLHAQLAARLGGRRGVADVTALAAALDEADAAGSAGGLFELAAALAGALARRRPFASANLALAVAAAGLLLRHYDLDLQLDSAERPALRDLLAADDRDGLVAWLRRRAIPRPLE